MLLNFVSAGTGLAAGLSKSISVQISSLLLARITWFWVKVVGAGWEWELEGHKI